MTETSAELNALFESSELDHAAVERVADRAYASARDLERFAARLSEFRARASESGLDMLRIGLALHVLGRHGDALDCLAKGTDNALRRYFAAESAVAIGRHEEAIRNYESAAKHGWDAFEIDMRVAGAQLRAENGAAAEAIAKKHERVGADRPDWHVLRGELAERRQDRAAALDHYNKARTLDPRHTRAMFRAAWLYDLRGEDAQAIQLYERLSEQPRAHVNALINLAVIYEDIGKFDAATNYLRRVLTAYPEHARARLFLRDVESSRSMVIDDGADKRAERVNRMLATTITEFELSVRARNCLKKMRIDTLGDLLRLREEELLSFKNFGETSLLEIKALLARWGLGLGQRIEDIDISKLAEPPKPVATVQVAPGAEAVLHKPVSELELTVRSRRCLQRLNVATVGDLVQYSEPDLLAKRNFGQTSLNEIKARLGDLGLTLSSKR